MRRLMVALAAGVVLLAAACANEPPGESLAPVPSASATAASQSASPSAGGALNLCWSAPAGGSGQLGFEDLTGRLGLEKALTGMRAHAVAVGDVNDDGWVDLFVGSFADRPVADYAVRGADGPAPDRLLLGSATGFAIDQSFPGVQARTAGAAFADLDADGDLDLVLSRNPRDLDRGRAPSVVLRNDRGRFSEAAVLDAERGGRSVGILDLDADGLLDIVLLEDRWSGGSSVLYRNTGGLRFTDHTAAAGLPADLHGLGINTTDLDGDRQPDLFVAGSNRLFLNDGGRFREEPGDVFAWQIFGDEDDVAGVAVGDFDRDGRPDLVLGQHFNSTLDFKRVVPVRVYRNLGPGEGRRVRFEDVTAKAGVPGLTTKAPHVEVVDLDADGWPDIVTTASTSGGVRPVALRNTSKAPGQLRFEAIEAPGGTPYWVTGATIDADHDGAVDLVLAEWEPTRSTLLFRTSGQRGHWLAVEVGSSGSRGIGAVVSVYTEGHLGEPSFLLGRREVTASTGFGAGAEPIVRFGLGSETRVDLEVQAAGDSPAVQVRRVSADSWVRVDGACPG